MATLQPINTLSFSFKRLYLKNKRGDPLFLLSICDKHDEMQLFTKFKKNMQRRLKATLNFRKFSSQTE